MKEFDLEKYVIKYSEGKGKFALINVPEQLQIDLINEFTFMTSYKGKVFKVNVHSNDKKFMVLKDYNHNIDYRKKFKK